MRDQLDSHRLLAIPSSPHRLLFQLPVTVRQSDIDNQAGVRGIKAHASTGAQEQEQGGCWIFGIHKLFDRNCTASY